LLDVGGGDTDRRVSLVSPDRAPPQTVALERGGNFWQECRLPGFSSADRREDWPMKQRTQDIHESLIARYPLLEKCRNSILKAHDLLLDAVRSGGTILVCGNGGSAADAAHITGELVNRFQLDRPIPESDQKFLAEHFAVDGKRLSKALRGAIPAVSLVSEMSTVTAVSNDTGSEFVFAQQVYAYGRAGSVLLAISTSGNSPNCAYAAMTARLRRCAVVALTGEAGGRLGELCDILINVASSVTYEIQEMHLPTYHALCAMLESELFGE
jgi:D-sedoheptulose 7-phosphate isomerase